MKLEAPTLNVNEAARVESIARVIRELEGRENPYAILSANDLTYVQALWTGDGYVVEYQEGSIDRHFVLGVYLKSEEVEKIFGSFLSEDNDWKNEYRVWRKNIRGFWGNLGYQIGIFFGCFLRGFRETREK